MNRERWSQERVSLSSVAVSKPSPSGSCEASEDFKLEPVISSSTRFGRAPSGAMQFSNSDQPDFNTCNFSIAVRVPSGNIAPPFSSRCTRLAKFFTGEALIGLPSERYPSKSRVSRFSRLATKVRSDTLSQLLNTNFLRDRRLPSGSSLDRFSAPSKNSDFSSIRPSNGLTLVRILAPLMVNSIRLCRPARGFRSIKIGLASSRRYSSFVFVRRPSNSRSALHSSNFK